MQPIAERAGRGPRAWRGWAIVIGALVLYVAVFDLLERLAPDPPAPPEIAERPAEPPRPVRPRITRIQDGVEVSVGFHRTTVRLNEGDGSIDDLIACFEEGVDRAIVEGRLTGSPSDDWFAGLRRDAEIADEMNRILEPCFRSAIAVPAVPSVGE